MCILDCCKFIHNANDDFPWETAKTCAGEMSKTMSVHDVIQSEGRAGAQQGAAVADTLSRHPYNVLKLEHCRYLKKLKQNGLCKP